VHAVLTKRLRFNTWKLAGWGMYATSYPGIQIVGVAGELLNVPAVRPAIPFGMAFVCGPCEWRWLRDYARREFFEWCHTAPAAGLVFSWMRRRGNRYVTRYVVVWNAPGAALATFDVEDADGSCAFREYLVSVAATLCGPQQERAAPLLHTAAVGVP
jgi:hypothetical protein